MRIAGIMSGTSLDGIDVAIIDTSGRGRLKLLAFETTPYPDRVRAELLAVSNAAAHVATLARLNFVLGELYARAVAETCRRHAVPLDSVDLIGCHGQTVFHDGNPTPFLRFALASTLQLGEAAVIAERTGIPVVSNFRPRDMAAGGKGAPLVPFVDYLLFRHQRLNRVALNIGGIANLTAIPAGAQPRQVLAFDTGPGNMVIDALVSIFSRGAMTYDRGGRIAAQSKPNAKLLATLMRDRYYTSRPPKTAGREQYGREFVDKLIATGLPLPELIATATALTAASVAAAVHRFVRPKMKADELIVSGGGAHNTCIMSHLAAFMPDVAVCTSSDYGVNLDAKEAIAFALLAYETLRGRPANLPSATGARRQAVLGTITPGNKRRRRRVV
ncbi:MAG TPA: anhydro-N-acetylmuramic acid kinase [Bryobacteraceae bacterium]|nr:anhydro-N-acetylmuramic acid kinase [Bryobacteraceae bacterium]